MNFARHGTQAVVSGPGVIITAGSPNKGGGNQKNMEAYSQYAPAGVASTAGVLSGPTASTVVRKGQVTILNILHSTGNTGVMVRNITFQGTDATLFSLSTVPSLPFLIGIGELRLLSLVYNGNKAIANASLLVTYSANTNLSMPLQGTLNTQPPTKTPSKTPTRSPTKPPTRLPTRPPTKQPSRPPTKPPTKPPTLFPNMPPTRLPTKSPTKPPTRPPTKSPTRAPTRFPTILSAGVPTKSPTTSPAPTPPTKTQTKPPTHFPTIPPTRFPTRFPTEPPTKTPTKNPTRSPTKPPTKSPTRFPTVPPTRLPTKLPTPRPTSTPTPVARFGTTCFPADGNLLRSSVLVRMCFEQRVSHAVQT